MLCIQAFLGIIYISYATIASLSRGLATGAVILPRLVLAVREKTESSRLNKNSNNKRVYDVW